MDRKVRIPPLWVCELIESGVKRVDGEMAGMGRGVRQAADQSDQLFTLDGAGIGDGLALHQLSERGGAGDGRNAAFGEETQLCNMAVADLQRQFEHIATGGILQLHGSVRLGD